MSGSPPSESEDEIGLVRRAKHGDLLAYDKLCLGCSTKLCTFLTHMVGNEEDAKEIAQEALTTAWIHLPGLREEQYFRTWLYRIAINEAKARLRRARRYRWLYFEEHGQLHPAEQISVVDIENRVVETVLMERALEYVSPMYRACLLLKIVEDLSQSKIAEILEIPVKNVSTYVKRGLKQLSSAYQCLENELDVPAKGGLFNERHGTWRR